MSRERHRQPARILVVEDDRTCATCCASPSRPAACEVALAENAQHGLTQLAATPPDAVVLDVGLPDMDGARPLPAPAPRRQPVSRSSWSAAAPGSEHRIDGLEAGADDYLPKPFDLGELRARLRALLRARRRRPRPTGSRSRELRLDRGATACGCGHGFVDLSRTELQLLELFLRNAGTVLAHATIYDRVWGYDFGPGANSLRVYVCYLRRKLAEAGARPLIHTVRGVGYVLREPGRHDVAGRATATRAPRAPRRAPSGAPRHPGRPRP